MKKTMLFLLLVVFGLSARAQNTVPLSKEESQELTAVLTEAAVAIQDMQCRFVQQKTMAMLAEPSVSEGVMYYSTPDKMRWEYTAPYAFALVVNGERIIKVTEGKSEVLDGKSNRLYQGMVSLIMGSATGKNLFDTSSFDVAFYDDDVYWKAEMTPKRRDMKRMFSKLVFRFDKNTNGIRCVEFVEPSGDITSIRFEDIQLNEPIEPSVFAE